MKYIYEIKRRHFKFSLPINIHKKNQWKRKAFTLIAHDSTDGIITIENFTQTKIKYILYTLYVYVMYTYISEQEK